MPDAPTARSRRVRRRPEVTEAEILDSAERLLREVPFRELTIPAVMAGTTVTRSAFWKHFEDRNELVMRLIRRIEDEMFSVAEGWLSHHSGDPIADVRGALTGVGRVYAEHGPVLAAIAEAAHHDSRVEEYFRQGLLERFIDAVARRIREEKRAGRSDVASPAETARALVLMNERYFAETLGGADPRRVGDVVRVLQSIWIRAIYGGDEAR